MLAVVKNLVQDLEFYENVLGLKLLLDNDGNIELNDGIYLQEIDYLETFIGKDIAPRSNSACLHFEESDMEAFTMKLERLCP